MVCPNNVVTLVTTERGCIMIFKIMLIFIFMFCVLQVCMYFDLIKKFLITGFFKLFHKKEINYCPTIKSVRNNNLKLKKR